MNSYLFLLTIGPVQSFIAAARKSRDLWAGSHLLSELSRYAAQELKALNATLIFPAQEELDKHEVVNRILARIETDQPKQVGEQIERNIRNFLREQAVQLFQKIPGFKKEPDSQKQALDQIDDLLEIAWACVATTGNYQHDRAAVEKALAARKATRDFRRPAYAAAVPKSSIDGLRESVIPERYHPHPGDNEKERRRKHLQLLDLFGAKPSERLSGVDLLKRHLPGSGGVTDFPSTSHIAALPWLARYSQTFASAFDSYVKDIRQFFDQNAQPAKINRERFRNINLLQGYDASIVFEERLAEDVDAVDLPAARSRLHDLYTALGSRPEPYYAILHADGDHMGKVIDHLATEGIEKHQQFSRSLDSFAAGVRAIVEGPDYRGALVYAGGDDVLAFLPLDTVLSCARLLAQRFAEALGAYQTTDKLAPTLSIGIAIVHHIEPLSTALDLARQAEKMAKRSRNALAIILSKRSGADTAIWGGWDTDFVDRLERWIELHQTDALPDGAAFELRDLYHRVGPVLPKEALHAEAMRILQRKRAARGQSEIGSNDLTRLEQTLQSYGVQTLANELIVAREFARARGLQPAEERIPA
ncbi:type III-B CRISPR-associated protein Cas10/Cmr2 [Chloroflexus sp.]|uniref:type III-B CRISPR-associated protein Cas10/Cmr2 n=1 Tax=Chloroflexus sp. TaxID=1904827 RepID=UPI00298F0366|nr:type III-B CRISPR-associated protein Cas10/Cmr2 [Chloroflexus sp.]MDW8405065.1 type III-B CRISPR-associated protein Cas10/Cmr2 [Chloroflexus sp.]